MKSFLTLVKSWRSWGVLALLLVLVTSPAYGQPATEEWGFGAVRVAGVVRRLHFDPSAGVPISSFPEGSVLVTFINAATGERMAEVHSRPDGSFETTLMIEFPRGAHVYALCAKRGHRTTASFIFHVRDHISGLTLPIVSNVMYIRLLGFIEQSAGVTQLPGRTVILTFFHPEGKWPDGTPGSLHRGVTLDSASRCAWPLDLPVIPPGDRVWLMSRGFIIRAVRDFRIEYWEPFASFILNADRIRHDLNRGVAGYNINRGEVWPRPPFEGKVPIVELERAIAPLTADIVIGVVRGTFRERR